MFPSDVIHEIDRLLKQGELSQREIAAQLRVSRGTVNAVSTGRRKLHGRVSDADWPQPGSTSIRCPSCGYRVFAPCVICSVREYRTRKMLLRRSRTASCA